MNAVAKRIPLIQAFFGNGSAFAAACLLTALAIPIFKDGIQFLIALMCLTWIFSPKRALRTAWVPILIFSGIYLFHLSGMLYTQNIPRGSRDLEQKLSLILFPLLFGTAMPIRPVSFTKIMDAFCIGVVLSVIVSFITSFINFRVSGDIHDFYMSAFSPTHHPSYLAMFINLAMAAMAIQIFQGLRTATWRKAAWFCIAFLSLSLVFAASKMGFINFLFLLVFLLFLAFRRGVLLSANTGVLLGIAGLFFLFLTFDPVAKSRVERAVEVTTASGAERNPDTIESNQARLDAWDLAIAEIQQHPLGVGTGDINDVMVAGLRARGKNQLADIGMNPHNNYLQIALALGIPAALWFIFSLLYPFPLIVRENRWLYAFFIGSIFLNFAVESMLEKQSGVIFFAFFNAMFFFAASAKDDPRINAL